MILLALVLALGAAGPSVELGGSRFTLVETRKAGSMAWGVAVSPDGASIYVAHVGYKDHDNVHRLDAATLERRARSSFRGHAVEVEVSSDGRTVWASNSRRHELVALEAETLAVRTRHATGLIPKDFALSPDERLAYVGNWGSGTLTRIDLASGATRHLAVGRKPRGVVVTRDGRSAWVANYGSGDLVEVDLAAFAVKRRLRACRLPAHVALVHEERLLLVNCYGGSELLVVDTARGEVQRRVRVGRRPNDLAVTRDGRFAVTGDEATETVSFVDLDTWASVSLKVPARKPCGVIVSRDDRRIYVTARGSDALLVIGREPIPPKGSR